MLPLPGEKILHLQKTAFQEFIKAALHSDQQSLQLLVTSWGDRGGGGWRGLSCVAGSRLAPRVFGSFIVTLKKCGETIREFKPGVWPIAKRMFLAR